MPIPDILKGLARGLTADVAGAPVDMATAIANLGLAGYGYAGNKLGLLKAEQMPSLIENAVGGSDWFAKNTPLEDKGQAGYGAGRFAGQLSPLALKAGMAAPRPTRGQVNAITWHGSPHKFEKFDSSKIGTGEGAQAYGHGLYLAENPKVAVSYKEALGAGRGDSDADTIARVLDVAGGDAVKAAAELTRRARYANIPGGKERLLSLAEQVQSGVDPRGVLYKVDLPDEQIARMLDWDKPLSQQTSSVQRGLADSESVRAYMASAENQRLRLNQTHPDRLQKIPSASLPYDATRMTGKDAYTALAREYGNQRLVSGRLNELGIPGLRYLDGSSRNLGDGTSNFVVFPGNEDALTILERNGKPLLKGLAGGR